MADGLLRCARFGGGDLEGDFDLRRWSEGRDRLGDRATEGDLRRTDGRLLAEVLELGDEWVCLLTFPSR